MRKCSQRSTTKVGKGLEKVVHSASETKKWTKYFHTKHYFPAVMNNYTPNSGLLEISLLHSQYCSSLEIRLVKKVLILFLAKQTAVLF